MSDDDFVQKIQKQGQLTEEEERSAGKPVEGTMEEEHRSFLAKLSELIDKGEIDVKNPESFLNQDVYSKLDEEWRDRTDLTLVNIADQIRLIDEFYRDKNTPNACPQLQTMVAQLWQMKQSIEKEHDVFKF